MVLHSVGGWSPVVLYVLQASLPGHWLKSYFLASVAPLCYSDLFHQCVSGLVVQDGVPISVGLLLGLARSALVPEYFTSKTGQT